MKKEFIRTGMLLGEDNMNLLESKRVAVFGIGGVGGHTIEALARSGVGSLDIIDNDEVCLSNLNRQIIALTSTVGRKKTEVMKERIELINPQCKVNTFDCFYLPEEKDRFPFEEYDYIVDAIDTVTAKIDLVIQAKEKNVPIICCMGTGNKLNPTMLEVADIYETIVCPLAKVMRKELKARGIKNCKVVFSKEMPRDQRMESGEKTERRAIPGSTAFVPAVAGMIIASEVIKDLVGISTL